MSPDILTRNDAALLTAAGITTTVGPNKILIISANRCQSFNSYEICSVRPTWKDGMFSVLFGERTPTGLKMWTLMFPPPTNTTTNNKTPVYQAHVETKSQIKLIARAIASTRVPRFDYGILKEIKYAYEWDSYPDLAACHLINYPQLLLDKDAEFAALTNQVAHLSKTLAETAASLRIAEARVQNHQSPTPPLAPQPAPSDYTPGIMGMVLAAGFGFIAAILLLGALSASAKL